MREITVKIKTLTPIWTGDANKENTTLRETGIIGSLRWWYEALIRGLGGSACDPTNIKCDEKNHCDACELFGCSGWSRKFRLEVESKNVDTVPELRIGTRERHLIGTREGYLKRKVAGFMSYEAIILKFIPLKEITSNEWCLLNKTLEIIEKYGALGAKTSQGCGLIEIVENNLPYKDKEPEGKGNENNGVLPNLNYFFFYKFNIKFKENISDLITNKVFWTHASDHNNFSDKWDIWKKYWKDYNFLPIAFHIRDAIRHLESNTNKRHTIFGESRKGSRVFVSQGYRIDDKTVEVRIWGYAVEEIVKNEIKKELKNKLKEKLFSKEKKYLEICTLTEEKTGHKILEGL